MLVKAIALTVFAVTPFAFVATQDPAPKAPPASAQPARAELERLRAAERQSADDLAATRRELEAARAEIGKIRQQLEGALDVLEQQFQPQRDRNCSPSRSRALLSHYQWLKNGGHEQRAAATMTRVVEQYGNDPNSLNDVAWRLMTDKETAGKLDDVALAVVQRLTQHQNLNHHQLDTAALAFSLAGQFDRAVALQQQAIERGGNGDEYRRRLRTYEAALAQVQKSADGGSAALLAGKE